MRWRRFLLGVVAAVVATLVPSIARADVQLVLPSSSLPGLHASSASLRAPRADLAAGLPRSLARAVDGAVLQSSAAAGRGQRLRSDAFMFASANQARRVLSAWRAVHRASAVRIGVSGFSFSRRHGRTTTVLLAWREGDRIGLLALIARLGVGAARAHAEEYAALADSWLRTPLPTTAFERALDQISPNGTLPKSAALQAFAAVYGPLPGVKTPAGARMVVPDGTGIAESIESYLPQLSRRQQRVVERLLGIPAPGRLARAAALSDPGFTPDATLQKLADKYIPKYEAALHHPLGLTVVAGRSTLSSKPTVVADATWFNDKSQERQGIPAICRLRLLPLAKKKSDPYVELTVAHELFHCFQYDLRGADAVTKLPLWIGEGTADWAAATIDPSPWPLLDQFLELRKNYLQNPNRPLFERAYDSVGFWGHVQDTTGNLWNVMKAVIIDGENRQSFVDAGADAGDVLNTWGSSFLRLPGGQGGPPWHMFSPIEIGGDQIPDLGAITTPIRPLTGDGPVLAPPYTLANYQLKDLPSDKPLLHISLSGWGRLSAEHNYTHLSDAWFCLDPSGCHCPPNTADEIPTNKPLETDAYLALGGDPDDVTGTSGFVHLYPIKDFCQPSQQPQQYNYGNGGSGGDPHIDTFAGNFYDFQAAGEFTLMKSTRDDLEIQVRQQPLKFLGSPVAMITAVAVRAGGATVEVDADGAVYLNQRRFRVSAGGVRLRGGGELRGIGFSHETPTVSWPDGTYVELYPGTLIGMDVAVHAARDRARHLVGLLGPDDGNPSDDFIGRNGVRYHVGSYGASPLPFGVLYGQYGNSWRIRQADSLFRYARGQSTASYTRLNYPPRGVSVTTLSPAARAHAEQVCRAAGSTVPAVFQDCVLDVGITGDPAYATGDNHLVGAVRGHRSPALPWTRLSSQTEPNSTVLPTILATGGRVVAAYRRRRGAIEVATFDAAGDGVSGISRTLTFRRWHTTTDPVLLPGPGGGAQLIEAGQHSGTTGDPLNGTLLVRRNRNGSFGKPALLSAANTCCRVTGAVLAADGTTPLWVTGAFGMQVYSGSTSHDLSSDSPGPPRTPVIGRDAAGHVWLAWYVISSTPGVGGIYMLALDPQTGTAIGKAVHAPDSAQANTFDTLPMACGRTCRVVYTSGPLNATKILSWAPGDRAPTTVFLGNGDTGPASPMAAYTSTGRLWVSWIRPAGALMFAKLGDSQGAGGTPQLFPDPYNPGIPQLSALTTLGDKLVVATDWYNANGSGAAAAWATVVNPP